MAEYPKSLLIDNAHLLNGQVDDSQGNSVKDHSILTPFDGVVRVNYPDLSQQPNESQYVELAGEAHSSNVNPNYRETDSNVKIHNADDTQREQFTINMYRYIALQLLFVVVSVLCGMIPIYGSIYVKTRRHYYNQHYDFSQYCYQYGCNYRNNNNNNNNNYNGYDEQPRNYDNERDQYYKRSNQDDVYGNNNYNNRNNNNNNNNNNQSQFNIEAYEQDRERFRQWKDSQFSEYYNLRWTFIVVAVGFAIISIASNLLRQHPKIKQYQKYVHYAQTFCLSQLLVGVTAVQYHNWSYCRLMVIVISSGLALSGMIGLMILNKRYTKFRGDYKQFLLIFLGISFIINTIIAFVQNRDGPLIAAIVELNVGYALYYLLQLNKSLTDKLRVNQDYDGPLDSLKQKIQNICGKLNQQPEPQDRLLISQLQTRYFIFNKNWIYLGGLSSIILLIILSCVSVVFPIIATYLLLSYLLDTQMVSQFNSRIYELNDAQLAATQVFLDYAFPLKNIIRSFKHQETEPI